MTDEAQSLFFRSLKAHREGDLAAAAAGWDAERAREEAASYLDDRAAKGFTVVQAVALAESLNMTLASRRPGDGFWVYTGADRFQTGER